MSQKIRKAIFPVGGLGTRFLPATKAMPKEMLPIVDKPAIQYLVEEAAAAGIEEIILVTGRGKRAIEDHFDTSFELEYTLKGKGKKEMLTAVHRIENLATFVYVRQPKPLGDGHAILCARDLIGTDEPFAIMFGDDLIDSKNPAIGQLMEAYEHTQQMVIGVQAVAIEDVSKYGIVHPAQHANLQSAFALQNLMEKPTPEEAPSNLAIIGKYICTPDIFDAIASAEKSRDGELRLIDGFQKILQSGALYAKKVEGKRYDIGSKIGFLRATVDFALQRKDVGPELKKYLQEKSSLHS